MALTEARKEYQRQWRKNNPGRHASYQRKWAANNPEKYKAIWQKGNRKRLATKFLNRRKSKFNSFHRGMAYRAEVTRLLLKGKDPIDIAMWTSMPVSVVMELKASLSNQPNV